MTTPIPQCPLCPCQRVMLYKFPEEEVYLVECTECHCRTAQYDNRDAAINAWNNRTDPTANLRKAVEEMMNSYRKEAKERKNDAYWRGAADACGNILDLPEMKLFLKEQQ